MESMAFIGAGMCALSMMAAAWGVSQVWTTIISTVGRNPQVKKDVDIYGWAGFAAVEAIALYALVIELVMLTRKKKNRNRLIKKAGQKTSGQKALSRQL